MKKKMQSDHYLTINKASMLFLLPLFLFPSIYLAEADYLYHICPNTTAFTRNSLYGDNLKRLLSSLSSNSTSLEHDFYNGFKMYEAGSQPDNVYGLFLCRGDVRYDVCKDCVAQAAQDIVQLCPRTKVATVGYDECLLRYSDKSMFSVMETSPKVYVWNSANVTEQPEHFNALVTTTLGQIATQAANTRSGAKKFATEEVNFTASQHIYTMVQCTPDLSNSDCVQCLKMAVSQFTDCCNRRPGGRVYAPSCNFRYEVYPFINQTAIAAGQPPPPLMVVPGSPQPVSSSAPDLVISSPPDLVSSSPPDLAPLVNAAKAKGRYRTKITIFAAVAGCVILFCVGQRLIRRLARMKRGSVPEGEDGSQITSVESLQFGLATIESATKKFSTGNKLGSGGFGEVYKGTLSDGQEIAVKRLSRSSAQGAKEFKNEVLLVAKLQHRNLVRLLGFCLEGEEKILIYEFVPNRSLDYFLFDASMQGSLDWSARQKVIGGIARGILYLHEDSRLRIIHRDLKAGNILLDRDMNPKISDFGMARLFEVDQIEGSTNRIVGTYGYMSPEYAMHGQFSVKSDVYSFGVLLLEIVSGKKNSSFYKAEGAEHLVSYVWKLWRDGRPLEAFDPRLKVMCSTNEVVKCIQIGLLCVQEDPTERPTMATVVHMLNNSHMDLPLPKPPAFFIHGSVEQSRSMRGLELDQYREHFGLISVDKVTITVMSPR